MQYVVCYDVSDDSRRSRLASALLDFGARVEESVFVANLDAELARRMIERVKSLVDPRADRVHIFELCTSCSGRTVTLGDSKIAEDPKYYII